MAELNTRMKNTWEIPYMQCSLTSGKKYSLVDFTVSSAQESRPVASVPTVRVTEGTPVIVLRTQHTHELIIVTITENSLALSKEVAEPVYYAVADSFEEAATLSMRVITMVLLDDEIRMVTVIAAVLVSVAVAVRSVTVRPVTVSARPVPAGSKPARHETPVSVAAVASGPEAAVPETASAVAADALAVAGVAVTVAAVTVTSGAVLGHSDEGVATFATFAFVERAMAVMNEDSWLLTYFV